MSKQRRQLHNITVPQLKQGLKYMAFGIAVETAILLPKKNISIGRKDVTVGGVFPMAQDKIADAAKVLMNSAVPAAAHTVNSILEKADAKDKLRNKLLDLVYDTLSKYSLNYVVTKLFNRSGALEKNRVTNVIRDYLLGILDSNENRDGLIKGLTEGVVNALRIMTDGTVFSLLVGEEASRQIGDNITSFLEKTINTDTGNDLVDKILTVVSHMETLTVPAVLTDYFNLPREAMADKIDAVYDKFIGEDFVRRAEERKLGDEIGTKLSDIEYDEFFQKMLDEHLYDLLKVGFTAASIGITILDRQEKKERKRQAEEEK